MLPMRRLGSLLTLAVALVAAPPALAQQPMPRNPHIEALLGRVGPSLQLSTYLDYWRAGFLRLDFDNDGALTPTDIELERAQAVAELRAAFIGDILTADFDGDGVVTLDEVTRLYSFPILRLAHGQSSDVERQQLEARITHMRADLNRDGRIDRDELLAFAGQRAALGAPTGSPITAALALDRDGDGRTTLAELLEAAEAVFRMMDSDGDGTVSKEEVEVYRRSAQQKPQSPPPK